MDLGKLCPFSPSIILSIYHSVQNLFSIISASIYVVSSFGCTRMLTFCVVGLCQFSLYWMMSEIFFGLKNLGCHWPFDLKCSMWLCIDQTYLVSDLWLLYEWEYSYHNTLNLIILLHIKWKYMLLFKLNVYMKLHLQ